MDYWAAIPTWVMLQVEVIFTEADSARAPEQTTGAMPHHIGD